MDVALVTSIFKGIPYDWLALGTILILLALDSLRSGIGRACAIAVALPVATVFFSMVAQTAFIGTLEPISSSHIGQITIFAVLAIGIYFAVRRMGLDYIDSGKGEPIQSLLAGTAATVVMAVMWFQIPVLAELWHMSDNIHAIFAAQYQLLWLTGSYITLAFARG